MKLRSLILVSALATMTAFGADIYSGNSVAAMAVPTTEYTLIAVPFKTVGGEGDTVKVADLVKTDGLTAGSRIYYYTGSNKSKIYYCWELSSGVWTPITTTTKIDGGNVTIQAPDTDFGIPCGSTLWLERAEGSSGSVLLYGAEPATAIVPALTAGTVQFLSNPKPTDKVLSNTDGVAGDQIIVPPTTGSGSQTSYTFADGKGWCTYTEGTKTLGTRTIKTKVLTTTEVKIPGGRGVWYVSKGESVPSITW